MSCFCCQGSFCHQYSDWCSSEGILSLIVQCELSCLERFDYILLYFFLCTLIYRFQFQSEWSDFFQKASFCFLRTKIRFCFCNSGRFSLLTPNTGISGRTGAGDRGLESDLRICPRGLSSVRLWYWASRIATCNRPLRDMGASYMHVRRPDMLHVRWSMPLSSSDATALLESAATKASGRSSRVLRCALFRSWGL